MNNRLKAIITLLIVAFLGGGLPVYVKVGLKIIPPFTYSFIRFFLALIILLPFLIRSKFFSRKDIFPVFLLSLLSTLNIVLFSFGVRLTTASIGQTIYTSVPTFAAILSAIIISEKINAGKIFGIILGFLGASLIVFLPLIGKSSAMKGNIYGNLLIFAGAISYALYSVLSKTFHKKYSTFTLTAGFIFTTMIVSLIFSFAEISSFHIWSKNISYNLLWSLLYVSIIGTVGYYFLYQQVVKIGTPLIASMTLYLQPVATFLWAFVLLGERLTGGFIIGAALSFFGAWLVTKS